MTANFKQFKELVEKKFGSLSNYSMIATGSFQTYKGLRCLSNTDDNYWKINDLKKLAKKTKFDLGKVEISGLDRLAIKCRMDHIIKTTDYKTVAEWLKDNQIFHPWYSGTISGRLKRKHLAFENLWKKLGL